MVVQLLDKKEVDFQVLIDEELLHLVDEGDMEALEFLISRYKGLVRSKSQTYYLTGGDREDVIQEGMIGLYKAICDYDKEKQVSFRGFADLCITRQIITAIKTATRQKHIPLNSYVSLDKTIYAEESERTLMEIIAGPKEIEPQSILLTRERVQQLKGRIATTLSSLEQRTLDLYLDGYTYEEISVVINRHVKSIDNALQRVKKKLDYLIKIKEIYL